jgi:serine protease Do
MATLSGNLQNMDEERRQFTLSHIAEHLLESDLVEELASLLTSTPEWMEARLQYSQFGAAPFLEDVRTTLRAFRDPLPAARVPVLLALYVASFVAKSRKSIMSDDIELLILLGRTSEALAHVRLQSDPDNRFEGYLTLHNVLLRKGDYNPLILEEAYNSAKMIPQDWRMVPALIKLSDAFAAAGAADRSRVVFEEVRDEALRITNLGNRYKELCDIIERLVDQGRFTEAEALAQDITEPSRRAEALTITACGYLRKGHADIAERLLSEAKSHASQIEYALPATKVWLDLAKALALLANSNEAKEAIWRASDEALHVPDADDRKDMVWSVNDTAAQLGYSVNWLHRPGGGASLVSPTAALPPSTICLRDTDLSDGEADEFWSAKDDRRADSDDKLRDCVTKLIADGKREEAAILANKIEAPFAKTMATAKIVIAEAQASHSSSVNIDKVLQVAQTIIDINSRVYSLRLASESLAHAGYDPEALTALDLALEQIRTEDLSGWESRGSLAESYAQRGHFDRSVQIGRSITAPFQRSNALRAIAKILAKAGEVERAEQMLKETLAAEREANARTNEEASALRKLGVALASAGESEGAREAFLLAIKAADTIGGDSSYRAVELHSLTECLENLARVSELGLLTSLKEDHYYTVLSARYRLAALLHRVGRVSEAAEMFSTCLAATMLIENDQRKSERLTELGKALAESGLNAEQVFF